ncbi:Peptidyl-prolyl cis-trans isomerase FKBP43 [Linum grandiflorum]
MAFWGAEVNPRKPLTLVSGGSRLRLTQATLGKSINGKSGKCSIQCNIGTKAPVYLCNLIPITSETCQIHAEFQESEDVVFSVIGPMTVHLIGYFKHSGGDNNNSTVSYGEDIGPSESETSRHPSEDEEAMNDSFINDDDPEEDISESEEALMSDCEADSVDETYKMPSNRKKTSRKRLKKAYKVSDSDSDHQDSGADAAPLIDLEAEDEDTVPLSVFCKQSAKHNLKKGAKLHLTEDDKDVVADNTVERQIDNLEKERLDHGKHHKLVEEDVDDFFSGTSLEFPKPREIKNERDRDVETEENAEISHRNKNKKRKRKSKTEGSINVEQLGVGAQKGEVASLGRKVKVSYTGKWKASGKVFDSNVDGCPLRFKLGDEGVMEEWNVALDGRQSGDSVKLTIPHSVWKSSCSGKVVTVPPVLPNGESGESDEGVIYEIKLLKVRKKKVVES